MLLPNRDFRGHATADHLQVEAVTEFAHCISCGRSYPYCTAVQGQRGRGVTTYSICAIRTHRHRASRKWLAGWWHHGSFKDKTSTSVVLGYRVVAEFGTIDDVQPSYALVRGCPLPSDDCEHRMAADSFLCVLSRRHCRSARPIKLRLPLGPGDPTLRLVWGRPRCG